MIGETLAKLGISQAEMLELLTLDRKPYFWIGEGIAFHSEAIFRRRVTLPRESILNAMLLDYGILLVENTTAETDVFNVTLPAGLLGTLGGLVLDLWMHGLNNMGTTQTVTWRGYLGTTSLALPADSWGASASKRWISPQFGVRSTGDPASQYAWLLLGNEATFLAEGSMSENSELERTLKVTVQFNAASVNLEVTRFMALLRYIQPVALLPEA